MTESADQVARIERDAFWRAWAPTCGCVAPADLREEQGRLFCAQHDKPLTRKAT
jgi:hypothetical protein